MVDAGPRNYVVIGLTPRNTVVLQLVASGAVSRGAPSVWDSGDCPSTFGLWGYNLTECEILRRGLTEAGHDRRRPRGDTMEVT